MQKINLKDFKIIVDYNSVRKEDISDEVYFSAGYKHYLSNSRIGLINPEQGGSPSKYKDPPKLKTTSLGIGSCVHECTLEKESFVLAPKCGVPKAKLGDVVMAAARYRKRGDSIYDAISKAATKCDYYKGQLSQKRIKDIIKAGLAFYMQFKGFDDTMKVVSDSDWDTCNSCINALNNDRQIQNLLSPVSLWGDKIESYNEDALFIDVVITYQDKAVTLPIKMKADNWTIDSENKILTLNDLKTSSKNVNWFMNEQYGSFYHYHYYRQFALYSMVLEAYAAKEYGYNAHDWQLRGNVLVVNTQDYHTRVCHVTKDHLKQGTQEYEKLFKMIAYYELFGYEEEVEFYGE